MRILCCLDGTNITQLQQAVSTLIKIDQQSAIGLLYVIDSGPRHDMQRRRESLFRTGPLPQRQEARMDAAETTAAQDILQEGSKYFPTAEILQRSGQPEQQIIYVIFSWQADVVLLCPRSPEQDGPSIGPHSLGHVARFVIDHAGCPVLLIRHTDQRPPQPPPYPPNAQQRAPLPPNSPQS
ncbi:universal stress protein [Ktedonobacteria bacterium brp13]|nr:universal stress protein [Ktedonobacteria bacterium brp13]